MSDKSAFEAKLTELIELGQEAKIYFHIEKCDPYGGRYHYLDDLPEDEWDEEDRQNAKEYEQLRDYVAKQHRALKEKGSVSSMYQKFLTQGIRVVGRLAPERLTDFEAQYRRKSGTLKSVTDYTISDGLNGIQSSYRGYSPNSALGLIQNQIDILASIRDSLGSVLFEIEHTLQMDMFDSELESARHLSDRGHLRAAGAVLGVVLEHHLKIVANRHGFSSRKKNPTIADFNEFLKSEGVVDVVAWRRIQGLADIRNLCDHAKEREPTPDDLQDFVSGVERILKSVL